MRIQVTKMMRIDAEPDPPHCTVVTDAVLSVQIKTMSRGSPDNKKEAPTHVNELARNRVIVHRSPENFMAFDKGKFAHSGSRAKALFGNIF
jgi:hypothetical protein